jgi:hypothetical protein
MSKYHIKEQLQELKNNYKNIKIERKNVKSNVIGDCVMSGIALFGLKYPSLLQFDQSREESTVAYNLKSLYGVENAPSDTYFREILDEVEPSKIRTGFKTLFRLLQTGKKLQNFAYYDGHYLLSLDGSGYFSSNKIHCEMCCEKKHNNGSTTYHHNLLAGAIVNPEIKVVIPICPEPILKQDGATKNDCELTAVGRLTKDFRREHPHLPTIVVEDALFGKAPHIQQLKELNLRYIIGVKSADHKYLFTTIDKDAKTKIVKFTDKNGVIHRYRYINDAALNKSNFDLKINFLEYIEIKPDGSKQYFSWITDLTINDTNLSALMKAGRARWKIENETFNTLKNQGYNMEHNFGHGHKYLSTVLSFLMMMAFLIDQIQLIGSMKFQDALMKAKSKIRLWFKIRSLFDNYKIKSWDDLFLSIAYQPKEVFLVPDTG